MKNRSYYRVIFLFCALSLVSQDIQLDYLSKLASYAERYELTAPALKAYSASSVSESDDDTLANEIATVLHECSKQMAPEEFTALAQENLAFITTLMENGEPADELTTRGTRRFNRLKVNLLRVLNEYIDGDLTVEGNTTLNNLIFTGSLINGPYAFLLPDGVGTPGQVLATSGTNPDQLYWTTISINGSSADIPNTLVERDSTGSFAATTITLTGALQLQAHDESGTISLSAPDSVTTYALTFPNTQPAGPNQTLVSDGNGGLTWETVTTSSSGILSINNIRTTIQFLTTSTGPSTAFTWIDTGSTHQLNIPYAANVTGANVGLITGADYQNFENTYTTVLAATSLDIPNTLVLRDGSGNFAAGTITANLTGTATYATNALLSVTAQYAQNAGAASFAFTSSTAVSSLTSTSALYATNALSAVTSTSALYATNALFSTTATWVINSGVTSAIQSLNGLTAANQFLTTSSAGTAFTWVDTGSTHQLTIPYAANVTGANVGLITGADYQNFENTYTTVLAATPLDIPNTLVKRDGSGNFAAGTITANLTGTATYATNALLSVTAQYAQNAGAASFAFTSSTAVSSLTSTSALYATNALFSTTATWVINSGVTSAIQSLNGLTAANQFLTTSSAGTSFTWVDTGSTHQLTIPYAANVTGANVGLITGADYQNFENTYTTVLAATSLDIPNTLVKRDNTGSFAATTITVTGAVKWQAPDQSGTISFSAPNAVTTYALTLPATQPVGTNQALVSNASGGLIWETVQTSSSGILSINNLTTQIQFLTTSTGPSTAFTWIDTGSTHQLNIPYAGNVTGANVGLITGQDWQNFETAYTAVAAATPNDIPNTLVKRDATGSFAATNITTTGYQIFTNPTGTQSVSLTAGSLAATYTLILPTTQATGPNQALFNNGAGQLSWVATLTGGIENLNGATAPVQYLATNTGGTILGFFSTINGNTLVLPYAGNVTGANVGLITGADYQNFENTYTTVLAATSLDIHNTLVKRDNNGSFVSTNITLTGALQLQGSGANTVSLQAPSSGSYTLLLPTAVGAANQVLATAGTNPDQLSWITTVTNATQLNWLYTATSADIPNTLVLRDTTGSFISTNITLTGCLIVDDTNLNTAGTICGSTSALSVAPQGTRALQATRGGNTRGTNAVDLQINNGSATIASGNYSVISGGASNTAQGQYDVIIGGQSNSTSITSNDTSAGYNALLAGQSNSITINDIASDSNTCGYNIIGGASNSIIISTTAATISGLTAGYNTITNGTQNSINISLPRGNFTPNTITSTITVQNGPAAVAITPNGQYAYVVNQSSNTVSVINIATNTVATTLGGFSTPSSIAITPNGQYAYVTNISNQTISIINLANNSNAGTINLGGENAGFDIAITPNGQYAYVAAPNGGTTGTVIVINLATNTVVNTISNVNFNGPVYIAITPNGQYAYVSNENGNSVSVINIATNTVVTTINGFNGVYYLAITPNGQYAYVPNANGTTVSVINLATNTITATFGGVNLPNGIAITPNGQYAYVVNVGNNTASVINLATNTVTATFGGFNDPSGIAITPNGQYAYVPNTGGTTVSVIFTQLPIQGENFIGGGTQNNIAVSPQSVSIGQHAIVGGYSNLITSTSSGVGAGLFMGAGAGSFIGGGSNNTILSSPGVIGGGYLNTILQAGSTAFIGGGQYNSAGGPYSTIGGGYNNIATGTGAAVLGGQFNNAYGTFSVALGQFANAATNNSFVWSDGSTIFTSTANNSFNIQATGGLYGTLGYIQLANTGKTYIGGISGTTTSLNTAVPVYIDTNNNLGTIVNNTDTLLGYDALNYSPSSHENTGIGYYALKAATSGPNTAVGYYALKSNTSGTANVAVGDGALQNNQTGQSNTAVGENTLNNSSFSGSSNVALGVSAGSAVTSGISNILIGSSAGSNVTTAQNVTVIGPSVTGENTSFTTYIGGIIDASVSSPTTAVPVYVDTNHNLGTIVNNTDTLLGYYALNYSPSNHGNTGIGYYTLETLTTGTGNTALGYYALKNTTGNSNIAIGSNAGTNVTTANNVIVIGAGLAGANTSNTCFIGGISGVTTSGGVEVFCNTSGQLGTVSSSNRYKENIADLGSISEKIYQFRPVQFNYKDDIEKWFETGFIAEEIQKIMPEIVVYKDGQPETVRYKHLPIMMLNEQQKDHKLLKELEEKNKQLEKIIAQLLTRIKLLEEKI